MESKTLFAKTPPVKLFFIASFPGAVSMLASALYQLLDGMMVGQILGETPFAALNLAMPFVIINFSLADLIGVGSSVPISVSLGRKDEDAANNFFTCACLMIVGTGVLIGAALFAAAPLLIRLMGAEGDLADFAAQYLRVYALCSPLTTIIFAVDNFLRICGQIRGSMFLNIFMSVFTAALEFTFLAVFGFGVWGAALATCLGMVTCVLIAFFPFVRGKLLLHFCRPRFSLRMIRQIIACGSPNFLNNIAGRITSIVMNFLLIRLGGAQAVSVYGILMYADGVIQPLLYGMCDSLQPAVGFNWGAGNYRRINAIEKCCYTAAAVVSLASAAVIFLAPEAITGLFVGDADAGMIAMSVAALKLFALTYLTRWFSFATQSYMLAVENALAAALISVSTALFFPVLLLAAFWPLGLNGIWMNFAGTALLAAVLAAVLLKRFYRTFRRMQRAQEEAHPHTAS